KERISAMKESFLRFRFMRMNGKPFIMTPTFTLFITDLPVNQPFPIFKNYFIDNLLTKGCTSFLTFVEITKNDQLKSKLQKAREHLINSPIDYVIGVKFPLRLLTPAFIRKCKAEKIPALFVEIDDLDKLTNIAWGWIREALFPYNCPFIPVFSKKEKDQSPLLSFWCDIMKKEKLPFLSKEIINGEQLTREALVKIGIYPQKSSIHQGSEVSYNLYWKGREIRKIDENTLFHYYNNRLIVTVHKGEVIRANEKVSFRPGKGEQVIINRPGFFTYDKS
ncbi:hypothetical protein J9303_18450, partial [Bacillaceae bacterium Marseille-Q3522]|nr:hypothetical protein [Bacillaceae bacterium Marseille-Q3522]